MSIVFKPSIINKKIFLKLDNVDANTKTGARHGLYLFGKKLRDDTNKDILRKPRSGETYIRKGRRHVSSVPGEAPANWTGTLRKSLDWKVNGWETMKFGYKVDYGKWVEEGTKRGLKARPGLKISIKKNSRNGKKFIEQEIKKLLQVK